jgi:hypothetical protein
VRLALHAIPPYIAAQIQITRPPRAREETPLKLLFEVRILARSRQPRLNAGF